MFTRADIKAQAREQIKGKIWWLFLCTLIITGITMVLSFIPIVGVIGVYIVTPPLTLGLTMVYLDITYGDGVNIATLFKGYQFMGKSIALFLLILLYTFLWSLLLIVPGIIKSYSYSMAFYILAENPEMSAKEALKESQEIMNGNKMNFFILQLSFLPWLLLVVVTLGIASIYVEPYMQLTYTNFYHNIKRQSAEPVLEEVVYAADDIIE